MQAYSTTMERQLLAVAESVQRTDGTSLPTIALVLASIIVIVPVLTLCGICGQKPPKHNKEANEARPGPPYIRPTVPSGTCQSVKV